MLLTAANAISNDVSTAANQLLAPIAVVISGIFTFAAVLFTNRSAKHAAVYAGHAAQLAQGAAIKAQTDALAGLREIHAANDAARKNALELIAIGRAQGAQMDRVEATANVIHKLINSAHGHLLRVYADSARDLALAFPENQEMAHSAAVAEANAQAQEAAVAKGASDDAQAALTAIQSRYNASTGVVM